MRANSRPKKKSPEILLRTIPHVPGQLDFEVVIPARFASSRFPGKPLADLGGVPMVVHACNRAHESGARSVHVATDDARIAEVVRAHGHRVVMTRDDHPSGTDRIAEAAAVLGFPEHAIVVNVQGDEPMIPPALIAQVAAALAENEAASMSTACHPINDIDTMFNPNVVKVVLNAAGEALYFSRAPIPWARDPWALTPRQMHGAVAGLRHIGIYGYRASFLRRYAALAPAAVEQAESLEQLRVLWHGFRIAVTTWDHESPPGVDTPRDLEAVRTMLQGSAARPHGAA